MPPKDARAVKLPAFVEYGDPAGCTPSGWVVHQTGRDVRVHVGARSFGRAAPGAVLAPGTQSAPTSRAPSPPQSPRSGASRAKEDTAKAPEESTTLAPLERHALGRLTDVQRVLAMAAIAGSPLTDVKPDAPAAAIASAAAEPDSAVSSASASSAFAAFAPEGESGGATSTAQGAAAAAATAAAQGAAAAAAARAHVTALKAKPAASPRQVEEEVKRSKRGSYEVRAGALAELLSMDGKTPPAVPVAIGGAASSGPSPPAASALSAAPPPSAAAAAAPSSAAIGAVPLLADSLLAVAATGTNSAVCDIYIQMTQLVRGASRATRERLLRQLPNQGNAGEAQVRRGMGGGGGGGASAQHSRHTIVTLICR